MQQRNYLDNAKIMEMVNPFARGFKMLEITPLLLSLCYISDYFGGCFQTVTFDNGFLELF